MFLRKDLNQNLVTETGAEMTPNRPMEASSAQQTAVTVKESSGSSALDYAASYETVVLPIGPYNQVDSSSDDEMTSRSKYRHISNSQVL